MWDTFSYFLYINLRICSFFGTWNLNLTSVVAAKPVVVNYTIKYDGDNCE
jgi:hypothetical protein